MNEFLKDRRSKRGGNRQRKRIGTQDMWLAHMSSALDQVGLQGEQKVLKIL